MQKIINKITGEIWNIKHVNLVENKIRIERRKTKYSEPIEEDLIIEISDAIHENAKEQVRNEMLESGVFPDFEKLENFNDWLAPEKLKRIYVSNEKIAWFSANAKSFIDEIYKEPKNPFFEINGGYEIYLNSVLPEALPILEQFGILIENRPEIITP